MLMWNICVTRQWQVPESHTPNTSPQQSRSPGASSASEEEFPFKFAKLRKNAEDLSMLGGDGQSDVEQVQQPLPRPLHVA